MSTCGGTGICVGAGIVYCCGRIGGGGVERNITFGEDVCFVIGRREREKTSWSCAGRQNV